MSSKDNGGPAFPLAPVGTGDPRDGMAGGSEGMSIRDWFAGQAFMGLLANSENGGTPDSYAKASYIMADAMIAERSKQ